MKTQEVFASRNFDKQNFDFFDRKRIEKYFLLPEEKRRNDFFAINYWDIGQLEQFEAREDLAKDQNPNPEVFDWVEFDNGFEPSDENHSKFVLSRNGHEMFRETFLSCFISGYWTLHNTRNPMLDGPNCQQYSLLIFASKEMMKKHLCTYPNVYSFCIDPNGIKHSIQTRIEIDLVKENAES